MVGIRARFHYEHQPRVPLSVYVLFRGVNMGKALHLLLCRAAHRGNRLSVKTYGARGIYFREDNFTLRKERVTAFCEQLLRKNISIRWMCETRIDALDESLLTLMHRAGCEALYIGVESGSQRVLDFLKKELLSKSRTYSACAIA